MTTTTAEHVSSPVCTTDGAGPEAVTGAEATEEARQLVADLPVLVEALATVADPLERARVATQLMKEVEKVRVAVARSRKAAVAQSDVSTRALAGFLGLSLGAAADLHRAAGGGSRRRRRDRRAEGRAQTRELRSAGGAGTI